MTRTNHDFVSYSGWMTDAPFAQRQKDESELRDALHLIKIHITESGQQSADLHQAVQLIVNVARRHGLLLDDSRMAIASNSDADFRDRD